MLICQGHISLLLKNLVPPPPPPPLSPISWEIWIPKTALSGYLKMDSGTWSLRKFPIKMLQNGSWKKKNIASLKHATYKIEEKSISTITNMKRGKKNLFACLE